MKRVRISKKWQKIMSCSGAKIVRYIAVSLICVIMFPSCTTSKDTCWKAYCREFGVNADKPTVEQENYYYDVWLESDAAYFYMEKQ